MKKYFKNIALFGAVLLCLTILQKQASLKKSNPFWGRNRAVEKFDYVKFNRDKFEMLFVGSSKTQNQINPQIINSILNIKSFNFGLGGVLNPEEWYIIERLIKEIPKMKKPKYIVIELQDIRKTKRLATTDFKYFVDYKRMAIAVRYFLKKDQYADAKVYFTKFVENQFNLGFISDQVALKNDLSERRQKKRERWRKRKFEKSSGFHALQGTSKKKRKNMSSFTNALQRAKKIHTQAYTNNTLSFSLEAREIYRDLILQCRNNEIIPILILTPGSTELIGLYRHLESVYKIDMSNPEDYPEFYNPDFRFDFVHLNSKGAKIYSRELANKLAPILNSDLHIK